jgi:hypothetical protein
VESIPPETTIEPQPQTRSTNSPSIGDLVNSTSTIIL